MTYGFRPENWPAFQDELRARGIAVSDIEKVEIRPRTAQDATGVTAGIVDVTVTLRSGRVETWSQQQAEVVWTDTPSVCGLAGELTTEGGSVIE